MPQDPWRCEHCSELMYNTEILNGRVYAKAGVPEPKYLNRFYQAVCTLCFDLYHIAADNRYFLDIQTKWEEGREQRKKNSGGTELI